MDIAKRWEAANKACHSFTADTARVISLVQAQPGKYPGMPLAMNGTNIELIRVAHRDITIELISLLEAGYTTVTVCHEAAKAFIAVKQAYAIGTVAFGARFVASAANLRLTASPIWKVSHRGEC